MNINEEIITFLNTHKRINVAGMEKDLKIPKTTLNRSLRKGKIPKKYLYKLSMYLYKYGFTSEWKQ